MSLREYLQKFVNVLPLSTELLIANITAVIFMADILLVRSRTLLVLKIVIVILLQFSSRWRENFMAFFSLQKMRILSTGVSKLQNS